jgi:hypothetical protein
VKEAGKQPKNAEGLCKAETSSAEKIKSPTTTGKLQQTAGVDILTPAQTKSLIIVLVLRALLELMPMQALLHDQMLQRYAGPQRSDGTAPRESKDVHPKSPDRQEQSYKKRPEGPKKAAGKDTRQKQDWRMWCVLFPEDISNGAALVQKNGRL